MTEKLQTLMTQAYSRWQNNQDMSQEDFWDTLSADERLAVFVGNFNGQVCNGGFVQWHDNDYARPEVLDYLARLCRRMDTEISHTVAELLTQFRAAQQKYVQGGESPEDWEDLYDFSNGLDSRFYEINEVWLAEVEATL